MPQAIKAILFSLPVFLGLAYWFRDLPLIRDEIRWVRNELGIAQSEAAAHQQFMTASIETGELRRIVTATGNLNATIYVEVGSQLSGQIAEVLVDFNDPVQEGQPLARLDQKSFQARIDEAEAALQVASVAVRTAQARAERAQIDARESEAQSAVLKARTDSGRVNLESANAALTRKETLQMQRVGAATEVEDARTRVASASAALREAEAIEAAQEYKIAASKADFRRAQSEFEMALASVPQKQASLKLARIDYERTTIRSPIDGVIVGRNINVGQTLATTMEAKTVFIVAGDLQKMEIHAKVDEADIGKIQVGQEAVFTVDAHPGRQFSAEVTQIRRAPQVQQNVVTYTVVLSADNRNNLLLPGMTALVRITVDRTGPVLKLPLAALRFSPQVRNTQAGQQADITRGKPASIWIVDASGEPKEVVVGLGDDDASHAAVLSGPLQPNDHVIVGEAARAAPNRLFGIRIGL